MGDPLRIYLAGLAVLVGAIIVNLLAGAVGLRTWYDVLKPIPEAGVMVVVRTLTAVEILFLFLLYPALLGLCAYLVLKITA
jgi:hypothetical protein